MLICTRISFPNRSLPNYCNIFDNINYELLLVIFETLKDVNNQKFVNF